MKPVQSVLTLCLLSLVAIGCASPSSPSSAAKSDGSSMSASQSQTTAKKESTKKDSKKNSKKDASDQKKNDSASSAPSVQEASKQPAADPVADYDVDTVLAQGASLIGQRISVIGNLPQAAMPDGNGGYATYILSDNGSALRFTGCVNFGSCKARLTGTLQAFNGEYVLNADSAEQLSASGVNAVPYSTPVEENTNTVYDVETVLASAPSLLDQYIEVSGNLGQNAPRDEQGRPILWLTSNSGSQLRFDGNIPIGGCPAILGGTLTQDDRGYVLQLESYQTI